MTKDVVKEGFEQAQKDARQKQVDEVKLIVTKTLEKLDRIKKQIKELQEEEKILKMDIEDLKEGKLDRIVERQEKDEKARQTSVVTIIRERVYEPINPWFIPYTPIWIDSGTPNYPTYTINCSVSKDSVAGTYCVNNSIVHLR